MWSKQADTRNTNKNMTSFKNKITHRKRKNERNQVAVAEGVDSQETDLATKSKQAEEKQQQQQQRQQKPGKNRGRNRGKKDAVNATESVAKSAATAKEPESRGTNGDVTERDLESADVVLRHPNNENNKRTNNSIKRYSDSFVIDKNDKSQLKLEEESDLVPPALTRAVSGFFIIDQARKARRFSDLFRPASNMKLSTSTECLKVNEKNSINKEKTSAKDDKKAKPLQRTNSNVKGDAKRQAGSPKVETKNSSKKDNVNHDSYLKRVRSKIYKTKNENAASKGDEVDSASKSKKLKPKKSIEVTGRIPEDEVAVLTPNGLRKSLTHFDFRMTRQTSNLERVRPQTVGPDKSINDSINGDKPVLAKAKSSSAINLSLLRTRRNQIMEKVASRLGAKDVQNEFDFIAFGSVNNVSSSGLAASDGLFGSQASLQKQPSWLHINREGKVEVKQGQPVSRSGSDRRPDAVREEGVKHVHQEAATGTESPHDVSLDKTEPAAMVSSTILPASGQRRVNVNINRSESVKEQSEKRKQRRNISDPSHNTTSGDVDLDRHAALSNTDSGSSSNSSISCNGRLSESPSNSIDAVVQATALRSTLDSDSDLDAESEQWQSFVPLEELKNLPPHEKKRQDVINELFHTESSHVRNLKVLYKIFYKKIHESQTLKPDELNLLFPNIKEILDLHTEFNKEMRRRRKEDPIVKELGHMLTSMFGDRCGESLKEAAAAFCERQQLALEFIKKRRERDSKFNAVLTECEKKRQCRRLQLQGILPTEMQRLTKYPLLLERLMRSHESSEDAEQSHRQEELDRLKRAHQMSKEILNHVNEATKEAHNKHRLEEIQKHLDTGAFERSDQHIAQEFKTIDLTKYRLILEGGMQLKRPNKPALPVHILLLEEAVIILYREGERFILKFFQSGSPAQPQPLSPIIKMNVLLARQNASSSCELFLLDTLPTNSQKYDLVAEDQSKRDAWLKHFNDATDAYKKRQGGKSTDRKEEAASDSETESVQDLPPSEEVSERAAEVGGEGGEEEKENASSTSPAADGASAEDKRPDGEGVHEDGKRDSLGPPEMVQTSWLGAEEWPLIQPSQVEVATAPVHTADTMLTSLEQIRRKDALVKQALEDKEGIVADMLSIPREHFQHIADMASMDTSTSNDIAGQVLASIYQVHQLQKAINESSNITESDAMAAKGGKFPACASQANGEACSSAAPPPLMLPASLVRDIAVSLNSQLTTLLSEVKQAEEERDRLRKEVHRMRESLHVEHNLHSPVPNDDDNLIPSTDCASD